MPNLRLRTDTGTGTAAKKPAATTSTTSKNIQTTVNTTKPVTDTGTRAVSTSPSATTGAGVVAGLKTPSAPSSSTLGAGTQASGLPGTPSVAPSSVTRESGRPGTSSTVPTAATTGSGAVAGLRNVSSSSSSASSSLADGTRAGSISNLPRTTLPYTGGGTVSPTPAPYTGGEVTPTPAPYTPGTSEPARTTGVYNGIEYDLNRQYIEEMRDLQEMADYFEAKGDKATAEFYYYKLAQLERERNAKIQGEGMSGPTITNYYEAYLNPQPVQPEQKSWTSPLTGETYYYTSDEEMWEAYNRDALLADQMRAEAYEKKYLEQMQLQNQYTFDQAVNELNNSFADSAANYRDMMAEADYLKAQNDDNLTLRLSQAGDLGGLGQKQYSDAQSSFDQQMFEIQLERQNAKNEIDRTVAELRAQGNYDLANAALEYGMKKLEQLDAAASDYYNNLYNIENTAYERRLAENELNYNRAMQRLQMGMFRPEDAIALGVDPAQAQEYSNRINVLANLDLEAAQLQVAQLKTPVVSYSGSGGGGYSSGGAASSSEAVPVSDELAQLYQEMQGLGYDKAQAEAYLMFSNNPDIKKNAKSLAAGYESWLASNTEAPASRTGNPVYDELDFARYYYDLKLRDANSLGSYLAATGKYDADQLAEILYFYQNFLDGLNGVTGDAADRYAQYWGTSSNGSSGTDKLNPAEILTVMEDRKNFNPNNWLANRNQ